MAGRDGPGLLVLAYAATLAGPMFQHGLIVRFAARDLLLVTAQFHNAGQSDQATRHVLAC
ncbi:hypothetical protein LCGC14_2670670, partial [marine sediment metagenome]